MLNKYDRKHILIRSASAMTLFAYLVFLAWRMFFYAYANYHRVRNPKLEYNLKPFKTLLDEGFTPMLFTDLTNPDSNKVYKSIGFIEQAAFYL